MGTMTAKPKLASNDVFGRLCTRAEIAAMTPREYRKYEASLKVYRDSLAVEETYRRDKKKAREEGREEGLAEGLAEGEKKKTVVIVKNLKSLGVAIDIIIASSGLSAEEIENI